ncbi:type II toxin-antitoxin system HicA family toxin [Methanolobus bombayensis]|uniref:type II toxin-antitoxin system HicA family toxin n=1 Tax=Methanolobus bombayensis TaxID=38023 RepID=UPI001AE5FD5B|nr:type II toxin-antitoxin system HicA family toxin [Methanolobus bombayensis]MBP1908376.1 putative RNA binding protein YcfA (HicA-like mRNA interferase family) [Methanolobus bombayensis]
MTEIKPLPAKKVIKALEKLGFEQLRQKGSHLFMRHPDGRTTIIPIHSKKDIGKGLIRKIINDAKISRDEWIELLKQLIIF